MINNYVIKKFIVSTLALCMVGMVKVPVHAEGTEDQGTEDNSTFVYDNDCSNCTGIDQTALFQAEENTHVYDYLCADVKVSGIRDSQLDGNGVTTITGKKITAADVSGKRRLYVYFSPLCGYCEATLKTLASTNYIDNPDVKIILFTDLDTIPDNYVSNMGLEKYDIVKSTYCSMSLGPGGSNYRPVMVFIDSDNTVSSFTTGPRVYPEFFARILGYTETDNISFPQQDTTLRIINGKSKVLPVFAPAAASNQLLTWTSSNPNVATVDTDGTVSAVGLGTATITAVNGSKSASYSISVVDKIPVSSIRFEHDTYNVDSPFSFYPKLIVEPQNAEDYKFTAVSSDTNIASVSLTETIRGYSVWVHGGGTTGSAVITITNDADPSIKAQCTVIVTDSFIQPSPSPSVTPTSTVAKQEMYRLYNPNSGEHFYTKDSYERDQLASIGWVYEGVGWIAPATSNTPVYRMYNPNAGEHHYTTNAGEKDMLTANGWNYEGIGWYSDDAQGVPLYRQYNPNAFSCNHNYTVNKSENDWLVSLGWNAEGIGWYGVK